MPAYQETKPQATDKFSDSQADIQNNFDAIKDFVDIDHETFNGGASPEGKHKQTTFPELGAGPTTLANEGALYTKEGATSAVTELFFRRESDGTELGFTEAVIAAETGWTYLPSGALMKWGQDTKIGAETITFDATHAFTVKPSVTAVPISGITTDTSVILTAVTTTTFAVFCSTRDAVAANTTFNWIAIGK